MYKSPILVDEITLTNVLSNFLMTGSFDNIIKKCLNEYTKTDYIDHYLNDISLESNENVFNLLSDNIQIQIEDGIHKK